jgi:hypothetical protein
MQMTMYKRNCNACQASGVYRGFAETKGFAIVCAYCEGKGWIWEEIEEFTERKVRTDIQFVGYQPQHGYRRSTENTPHISYAEFLAGQFPTKES